MARGHLRSRSKGSWTIVLELGHQVDPRTGSRRRKQKWVTIKGTKRQAEEKLAEMLLQANHGDLVDPTKMILAEWLDHWVELAAKPPLKRPRTYEAYRSIIERHLKPGLGQIRLQELEAVHLEEYYTRKSEKLSQRSLEHHHTILSMAFKSAVKKRLLRENPAKLVDNRPRRDRDADSHAQDQCWTQEEARRFLRAAREFGSQAAAFYVLALDTGMRKGELCGVRWPNVDPEGRKVTVLEQLLKPGPEPVFGPPKSRSGKRVISIGAETARLLKAHRRHQAELKMKNRANYHDFGLVFAKEWKHMSKKWDTLGHPLQMNNLGQREFKEITEKAGVRAITFHGMRHTSATLALSAGVPVKVVSERLGHRGVEITMDIYQHVLPDMQEDAAERIGAILF